MNTRNNFSLLAAVVFAFFTNEKVFADKCKPPVKDKTIQCPAGTQNDGNLCTAIVKGDIPKTAETKLTWKLYGYGSGYGPGCNGGTIKLNDLSKLQGQSCEVYNSLPKEFPENCYYIDGHCYHQYGLRCL